jgi:hypothetical protein
MGRHGVSVPPSVHVGYADAGLVVRLAGGPIEAVMVSLPVNARKCLAASELSVSSEI